MGLRGGYEITNLITDNREQAIYGVNLAWRPTERTDLSAMWEERFFGKGWDFRFSHRMPRLAWSVSSTRDVASFAQAFFSLPPTNNVSGLLDAAFTTRFPDPAERARIVADLISRLGLPRSLASETALFTQNVTILTSLNASIAYLGVRNSIVLSGFGRRNEDLPGSTFGLAGQSQASSQDGAALVFTHQATTLTAINLTGEYTRTRGLGINEGELSKQRLVRLQVTRQLAAKTTAYVGAQVQKFESNVSVPFARENSAFVGLGHRF
jgi:uncharacterized protein (PEP-CTERM system associated)